MMRKSIAQLKSKPKCRRKHPFHWIYHTNRNQIDNGGRKVKSLSYATEYFIIHAEQNLEACTYWIN